jgi:CHASE2 domain-containing sensor protein
VLDRLAGACLAFLAAAVAVYVAVRLIESVAAALVVIAAVAGGLLIASWIAVVIRRRRWPGRW